MQTFNKPGKEALKHYERRRKLIISIFSFSHNVFYTCQGKGLTLNHSSLQIILDFLNLQSNCFYTPVEDGTYYGITRGGQAGGRPVLCPEHISKTTLARVMKFHGWIDLIQGECSAQES